MITIGIVAGEASGDMLGSHLVSALKKDRPDIRFVGIAGPKMQSLGVQSLFAMDQLSVHGYSGILKKLPQLLRIRKSLLTWYKQNPPSLFIGIDAPDFNLGLEQKLKARGIPTLHYVSPSIWAWRGGRVSKIRRSVSLMLTLFPFESTLYRKANIPVTYVGHPLADIFALTVDRDEAKKHLHLDKSKLIITLLPGSRRSELEYLADLYVRTAQIIYTETPQVQFLVPAVSREMHQLFREAISRVDECELPIRLMFGHSHAAMAAGDVALITSGTATLEAMLLKCPMVICYKSSWLNWQIFKHFSYTPYVGLPNILAGKPIAPEYLQYAATPKTLAKAVLDLALDKNKRDEFVLEATALHHTLQQDGHQRLTQAILGMLP